MQTYLITLITAVFFQIIGVLGIFFILGFVHSKLQYWTHTNYRRTLGWKGILWTAWIGTPIHEIGHAFFAKLFRHKITNISIFRPDEASGNLGHVDHLYNPKSLYQRIGNFFIGAAPMIFGSLVLIIFLYFFVPNGKDVFQPLAENTQTISGLIHAIISSLKNLFSSTNISTWNFWLFLYVSFAISSHMAPSGQDQKGMWKGFAWLVVVAIVINAITLSLGVDITHYVLKVTQYMGVLIAIFIYALMLSFLHLILSSILLIFKR
ncbi:MAG: hypothetical protein A2479_03705 [Candidatus Magasanikbacteria bacterium RIFOXYC2_FULL_39_8]|nr:MAG: hypothetical protein A2479_03705 [Candidatus Magasanikbacteria bacterium RIFOXYC2_FULL_39_8]